MLNCNNCGICNYISSTASLFLDYLGIPITKILISAYSSGLNLGHTAISYKDKALICIIHS